MKTIFLLPLASLAFLTVGCETVPSSHDGTDHKPRYNYFENGGGACCPYHAQRPPSKQSS